MIAKVLITTLAFVSIHSICHSQSDVLRTPQVRTRTPAEKKNSFYVKAGKYHIKNTFHAPGAIQQIGLAYNRRLTDRFTLAVEYAEWNSPFASNGNEMHRTVFEESSYTVASPYVPNLGQLEERKAYRMLDLGAWLESLKIGEYGAIRVGMAVSICWGINSHLRSYFSTPYDAFVSYSTRKKEYLGVVPKISYQKNFLDGRVGLAAEYAARYYPNRIKIQQDVNIAIGINF